MAQVLAAPECGWPPGGGWSHLRPPSTFQRSELALDLPWRNSLPDLEQGLMLSAGGHMQRVSRQNLVWNYLSQEHKVSSQRTSRSQGYLGVRMLAGGVG